MQPCCSVAPVWTLWQHVHFKFIAFAFFFSSPDVRHPNKKQWMDSNLLPKSQAGKDEEEEEEEEEKVGVKRIRAGLRVKRERRQAGSSATMCQVCNMRLNSSAQAQIHYRGKTHQRRLRRLAKAISAGREILFQFALFLCLFH